MVSKIRTLTALSANSARHSRVFAKIQIAINHCMTTLATISAIIRFSSLAGCVLHIIALGSLKEMTRFNTLWNIARMKHEQRWVIRFRIRQHIRNYMRSAYTSVKPECTIIIITMNGGFPDPTVAFAVYLTPKSLLKFWYDRFSHLLSPIQKVIWLEPSGCYRILAACSL
jgi:hypothetical protein